MKKLLLIALSCFGLLATAAHGQTIRFALEASYPPFEYKNEKGEIEGFDVDVAKAICSAIKADCTFTHQSFDSLIPSLKFRRFDASISAIDVTPERKKQVAFTDTYYENSAIFVSMKGKYTSIDNLDGKRVGTQNGTTHQKYMEEKMPKVKVVAYDSYQNAILDLKSGRLEAVFGDTAVIAEWLKSNPDLSSVGKEIADPNYFGIGMAIALNKDNAALLKQLNEGLKTIRDDGTYQTIFNKWFGANQ